MKREIEEYPNWSFCRPNLDGFLDFEYKVKIDGITICLNIQYCQHFFKTFFSVLSVNISVLKDVFYLNILHIQLNSFIMRLIKNNLYFL